jgi:hypothetical protein
MFLLHSLTTYINIAIVDDKFRYENLGIYKSENYIQSLMLVCTRISRYSETPSSLNVF